MASLVSPGISVSITNESFFIPASAPTVPLIFLATAEGKFQADGITPAAGTFEHDVIRTVTSLKQSTELYGIPKFLADTAGNQYHGDARNEYGLFALNHFLGIGSKAFAIRSNVNLDNDLTSVRNAWDNEIDSAAINLTNLATSFISQYNTINGYTPSTPGVSGHQDVNFTAPHLIGDSTSLVNDGTAGYEPVNTGGGHVGGDPTGLANNATVYTATVAVDGGVPISLNITGSAAQTYTTLLGLINTALGVSATAAIVSGNIRITSALLGPTSSILITDTSLFNSLSGWVSTGPAVAGSGTVYTATVTINGTGHPVSILGSYAQTFTTLLSRLNTALGVFGSATLVAGNIRIFSATTGPTSTVVITAGTLFAPPLSNFSGLGASVAGTISPFKVTVTEAEFLSLVTQATASLFSSFTFVNAQTDFIDSALVVMQIYANGYSNPATGSYQGLTGDANAWVAGNLGSTPNHTTEWTPTEAANTLIASADKFKFTILFQSDTVFTLGANDAARRVTIVTALAASINSNTDIRSENFEYNLVLCPGYPEVVVDLINLVTDIKEEAFVIADTPMNLDEPGTATWANTVARQHSINVAYYYPAGLAANLDGVNVAVAASGIALRTYTFSDSVSQLWFAPAGTRRGIVTGVDFVGYVTGSLGGPTTFVELDLNQGQRDDLYQYFTNINPIVFFPGRGLIIWGQKTSAPDASALDRVNVSRLVKYVARSLRKNTMSFVFEPNDQLTRNNLKSVVDAFLGNLIVQRGLYDYATICDTSNNTPAVIDQNELIIDVAIKPVKAAEFIIIPIRIVSTGAQI